MRRQFFLLISVILPLAFCQNGQDLLNCDDPNAIKTGWDRCMCAPNYIQRGEECVVSPSTCFMITDTIKKLGGEKKTKASQITDMILLRAMFSDELISGCGIECLCAMETTIMGGE